MKKLLCWILLVCHFLLMNVSLAQDYSHLDPDGLVPKNLLNEALNFYQQNQDQLNIL